MELKFTVQTKIRKAASEVFDAVYNPSKLTQYFATGGSSAPLAEGTTVIWKFADFPGEAPVRVKKVIPDKLIEFEWDAGEGTLDDSGTLQVTAYPEIVSRVRITFDALDDGSTLVRITEHGWPETQKGLDLSYGNCQGWTEMSCCLKAFLEHGINLRQGAY